MAVWYRISKWAMAALAGGAMALGGCNNREDPISFVTGLRILTVKADPPEATPGQMVTLTALAVDTANALITIDWVACILPPDPNQPGVDDNCIVKDTETYLLPLGSGTRITAPMPHFADQLAPSDLVRVADGTGGIYLPIRLRAHSASGDVTAVYRLRQYKPFLLGNPPNKNPVLDGLFVCTASPPPDAGMATSGRDAGPARADGGIAIVDGGAAAADAGSAIADAGEGAPQCRGDGGTSGRTTTSLDDYPHYPLRSGDQVTLHARFTPTSLESYGLPSFDPKTKKVTTTHQDEQLEVHWYANAGSLDRDTTNPRAPDPTWTSDKQHPPPASGIVDVWAVGLDGRGGVDWKHGTLKIQ